MNESTYCQSRHAYPSEATEIIINMSLLVRKWILMPSQLKSYLLLGNYPNFRVGQVIKNKNNHLKNVLYTAKIASTEISGHSIVYAYMIVNEWGHFIQN